MTEAMTGAVTSAMTRDEMEASFTLDSSVKQSKNGAKPRPNMERLGRGFAVLIGRK